MLLVLVRQLLAEGSQSKRKCVPEKPAHLFPTTGRRVLAYEFT